MLRISTQKPYFLASNPSFLLFSEEFRVSTIHAIGRLSQQPTGQSEICNVKCEISPAAPADFFMQNKPNLCVFWAVRGDCEEKQTQFKPNSKPIQTQSNPKQTQSNPNQTQSNPISPRKTGKIPCSTVNCSTVYFLRPKACRKPNQTQPVVSLACG